MTIQEPRSTFGPESLTRFSRILEDVMVDLIGDGVPAVEVRSIETRSKLSHMLLGFARSWWTDTQQLLLRALRNEISARKYATASGRVALPESVPLGADGLRSGYLGVDKSGPPWRKPVRAPEPES